MRVLVAGATGYLGGHVGRELKRRGHVVRALVRRADQRAAVQDFADEVAVAQVTAPSTLTAIAEGADAVFSSIGITRQRDGGTYDDVDYRGNLNLLNEALKREIGRFIYVSVFRGRLLRHIRLIAAKERFVDALQRSGVNACVVRPTGFFTDMAVFVRMARHGVVMLLNDGTARINPVSGQDAAIACVDALTTSRTDVSVGGPDIYTYEDISKLAFSVLGKRTHIWHAPAALMRVVNTTVDRFAPPQISGALQFVAATSSADMVAPPIGTQRLRNFFESISRR